LHSAPAQPPTSLAPSASPDSSTKAHSSPSYPITPTNTVRSSKNYYNMIILEPRIRQLLIEDALDTFPDECCGFLFGREETDGTRLVVDILVVDNSKQGDKTRRFEISPQDYMTAEQHALDHDGTLLAIYNSH